MSEYDNCGEYFEDRMNVYKGDYMGFVDKSGKLVVQPKYLSWSDTVFKDGYTTMYLDDYTILIDKSGREIYKIDKGSIIYSGGDYALVSDEDMNTYCVRVSDGKEMREMKYKHIYKFSDGLAAVDKDSKRGYVDKKFNEVIKPQFMDAGDFIDGYALVRCDDEELYAIDKKLNKNKLNLKFDEWYPTECGLTIYGVNGKYGLFDNTAKVIVPPIYDDIEYSEKNRFNDSRKKYYYIYKDGKMVVYDRNCKEVYKFQLYDGQMIEFCDNFFLCKSNQKQYYLYYHDGKKVMLSKDYQKVKVFKWNLLLAQKNGKWGLINYKDKEVLQFDFDEISLADDSSKMLKAKKDGKWHFYRIDVK